MPRPLTEAEFWATATLNAETGCLEILSRTPYAKGRSYRRFGWRRKRLMAHRIAWELTNGPIPNDLRVLHRCDNPPCVNPAHLFLGTQLDNIAYRHAKGRDKSGPDRPHRPRRMRVAA